MAIAGGSTSAVASAAINTVNRAIAQVSLFIPRLRSESLGLRSGRP